MKVSDFPLEIQQQMPSYPPTVQHYVVTDFEQEQQGVMSDFFGRREYGDADWELILKDEHPDIICEPIEVTIH